MIFQNSSKTDFQSPSQARTFRARPITKLHTYWKNSRNSIGLKEIHKIQGIQLATLLKKIPGKNPRPTIYKNVPTSTFFHHKGRLYP